MTIQFQKVWWFNLWK